MVSNSHDNDIPLLWARGLSRSFDGGGSRFSLLVDHIALPRGVQLAVVGPSGCGKSTLLGLLSLALRPDRAEALMLDGVDAAALWRRGRADQLTALRSRSIGFVPQTAGLLPFLTLGENIALPQRILRRRDPPYLQKLAAALGIGELLQRLPAEVSVGERQRAAVARALAHRPPILLADEPTASVHPAQADEILELMCSVTGALGAALLITTHDPDRAVAAGFVIAPCQPDATSATTRFGWPPAPARAPGTSTGERQMLA
jgi:putative ABC transport system ATP-binding protein